MTSNRNIRKRMAERTEQDEEHLDSALKKAAARGKARKANRSVGAALRQAFKENA